MAVTTDQLTRRQECDRTGYPVAASTTLYGGTLAFLNSSGYADDDTATGANKFVGITVKRYDNSSGANGDIKCDVWHKGIFVLEGSGFAQTSVGLPVFATDNFTVTITSTDNAVYIGTVAEYLSATKVAVELDTTDQRIGYVSQAVAFGDFTDGGSTSGYVDLDGSIPVGAIVTGWKAVTPTGFTGDSSATIQVGVSGDVDRFSAVTSGSVFAAGTVGSQPADDSSAFISSAATPRVTVTSGSDFGSVSAGSTTITIQYIKI